MALARWQEAGSGFRGSQATRRRGPGVRELDKLTEGAFRGPSGKTARDDKDPVPYESARRSGSRFCAPGPSYARYARASCGSWPPRARRRRRSIAGPRRGRRRGRRRRGLTIDRALARATGLMVAVAVPTSRRAQRRPVVIHAVHAECGNPTISCEVCLNARVAWSSGDERRAALRRIAAPPRRRGARERAVRLPPSRPVSALPPCCSGRGGGANDT